MLQRFAPHECMVELHALAPTELVRTEEIVADFPAFKAAAKRRHEAFHIPVLRDELAVTGKLRREHVGEVVPHAGGKCGFEMIDHRRAMPEATNAKLLACFQDRRIRSEE